MTVDPELLPLLEAAAEAPPLAAGTPQQGRAVYAEFKRQVAAAAPTAQLASARDLRAGATPAREYRPLAEGPLATVVYFHGGGFVIGDLDTHDAACRLLARDVGAVVVSVDYRLAPEHRFPAAPEDALTATEWALESVERLGGDPRRVAVAGDSAGGNLAAAVAQKLGDRLAAQLLIYPAVDLGSDRRSHAENASGYLLEQEDVEWFHSHYLADPGLAADPLASPLHAPRDALAGAAPAVVATARYDPLRDDGDAYAEALADAGVAVVHRRFDGLVHGFWTLAPVSRACAAANALLCDDLGALLAAPRAAAA